MLLTDTHCHLDFNDFDHDRDRVVKACAQVGVKTIIVPATEQKTWHRTLSMPSLLHEVQILTALGMHPVFNAAHQPQHLSELELAAHDARCVAIGEIGLDFHASMKLDSAQKSKQLAYFEKQLVIAQKLDKPIIVHNRKAHDECISILKRFDLKGGIIHAFNGSIQHAEHYMELGFCLGFGGMLTFPRSSKLQALVKAIPIEHIVLETDAPDMTVMAHRGERNSPEFLLDVMRAVAQYKELDENVVASHTTENARRTFGLN